MHTKEYEFTTFCFAEKTRKKLGRARKVSLELASYLTLDGTYLERRGTRLGRAIHNGSTD